MKTLERVFARRTGSILLCGLLLAALPVAARERKILQRTTPATTDPQARAANAWLDSSSTTTNNGTGTTLEVDNRLVARSLVQFDLSSIPNAGIKLATLGLFMTIGPTSGNARTYNANRVTSLWAETGTTWTNRLSATAWGLAGGDLAGSPVSVGTGTGNNIALTWAVTSDVQRYFGSTTPSGNYGWAIMDSVEGSNHQTTSIISSDRNATLAQRPSLTVEFVQNVTGLTATAGNGQVTLNWSYPSQVTGSTIVSATTGVLILRQTTQILSSVAPVDSTTTYTRNSSCSNVIGAATIVFVSASLPTSFNDSASGDNPNCPPANDTVYFYKVFVQDAAHDYSGNGTTSSYVPETLARPSATLGNQEATTWMAATGGTALAAPGTLPGTVAVIGSNANLLSGINPANGSSAFNPISLGGAIAGTPTVLDSSTSALARNVAYIAAGDGFVYAIDVSTGDTIWMTNPTGLANPATTNGFTASTAVVTSSTAALLGSTYNRTTDLVVVGTRNAANGFTNRIVGIDGSTGATVWQLIGSGILTTNALDIVVSSPFVDYKNNAIWVTSRSGLLGIQPSLWKIDPTLGTVLATANLGNISSSPILTFQNDVLFVGNDAGTLFAINPATAATLKSFAGGDTKVIGSPLLLSNSSPYSVVIAGAAKVQKFIFDANTKLFTTTGAGTWSTTMPGGCVPSAPIGFPGLADIYVSCSDGNIYQLDDSTGVVTGSVAGPAGSSMGDPTLDLQLSLIMAGNIDGRVFTFPFPF